MEADLPLLQVLQRNSNCSISVKILFLKLNGKEKLSRSACLSILSKWRLALVEGVFAHPKLQ